MSILAACTHKHVEGTSRMCLLHSKRDIQDLLLRKIRDIALYCLEMLSNSTAVTEWTFLTANEWPTMLTPFDREREWQQTSFTNKEIVHIIHRQRRKDIAQKSEATEKELRIELVRKLNQKLC